MKSLNLAVVLVLIGLVRPEVVAFGPAQARAAPLADARIQIMAAEDRRMTLPPGLHTPAIDALRESLAQDAKALVELARSGDARVQAAAIRALGRYESRDYTATILQYLGSPAAGEAATALAQSLRGEPLALDSSGQQVQGALEALVLAGQASLAKTGAEQFAALGPIARALGRLPYVGTDQVRTADAFLLTALKQVSADVVPRGLLAPEITRAFESLARISAKLAPPGDGSVEALRRIVTDSVRFPGPARVNALAALISARAVNEETLREAATSDNPDLKRLAVTALAGAGSPIDGEERTRLLSTLLSDSSLTVRIEAVRAWTRTQAATNGCGRLLDVLRDSDLPVVLVAIDALGDACRTDQNVTDWLTLDLRTPPAHEWHRASHALVALARRAPDRAAIAMTGHLSHPEWQVRMYAARAAAVMNDTIALERLGYDPHPNVREATLAALRRLKGAEAAPFFVSALGQDDYQLLRTAANELKGATPTAALTDALLDALTRVTGEKKETSRDARLALLVRIDEFAGRERASALIPLLDDFDIPVAMAAASILQKWTGRPQEIAPRLLPRPSPPTTAELEDAAKLTARVTLTSGKVLALHLHPGSAPLMSVRFLRLARAGYYAGLTIHRIVPNFVFQGGSPGANEYTGDGPFVRDEISLLGNTRGSVGLSTRGRDTGDAQFYFNVVDNPRLDYEYTVFGDVGPLDRMDRILEGDTIESITFEPPAGNGRVEPLPWQGAEKRTLQW